MTSYLVRYLLMSSDDESRRGRQRVSRSARSVRGMCTSHTNQPIVPGKTICQECLDYRRAYRLKRIENGLCSNCAAGVPVSGNLKCQECIDAARAGQLKHKFGVSVSWYEAKLAEQENVCAICHKPEEGRRLAVDHDHDTGKVRDLLCGRCNTAYEMVDANPAWLVSAANYRIKHLAAETSSTPLPVQGETSSTED